MTTRPLQEDDHIAVVTVVDAWWGGREVAHLLPRLFFQHFSDTSFAMDDESGRLIAFLVGFLSQSRLGEAYIHFVGVDPAYRGEGLGRALYQQFFEAAGARDARLARAITSPLNEGSIRFHKALGFRFDPGDDVVNGVPVTT